jgi:D-alanyl-D-alanine carboxypeptidase (penicillin-binding protein 5/6)
MRSSNRKLKAIFFGVLLFSLILSMLWGAVAPSFYRIRADAETEIGVCEKNMGATEVEDFLNINNEKIKLKNQEFDERTQENDKNFQKNNQKLEGNGQKFEESYKKSESLNENYQRMEPVEESVTYAKSMALIEVESGRLLYKKNCDEKLAMASTTKIMTALVAIKNCRNLDEKFKVDNRAVGVEGTSLYLRKNEEKTVRELLYGLMLPSGNDAAIALACKIAGSEEEFCRLMNEEAKRIGAFNTNFINPHGLDVDGHYTTAYDLALITAEAMKNKIFREICSTKNIRISGNEEVEAKFLKSKNKLLWSLNGCNGVKTGFTDSAGRCYVCSVEREGMTLICVVLNCGPMFEEAEKFLNLAHENYRLYELLNPYSPNKEIAVEKGVVQSVETMTMRHFYYPLTIEEFGRIEYEVDVPQLLEAPIKKEQVVGELKIKLDNNLLFSEKIYTMNDVESTKFFDKIEKIINYWNI